VPRGAHLSLSPRHRLRRPLPLAVAGVVALGALAGWRGAWLAYAALALGAAIGLFSLRERFAR